MIEGRLLISVSQLLKPTIISWLPIVHHAAWRGLKLAVDFTEDVKGAVDAGLSDLASRNLTKRRSNLAPIDGNSLATMLLCLSISRQL